MLGYCPTSVETIAAQTGTDWQRYAAGDHTRRRQWRQYERGGDTHPSLSAARGNRSRRIVGNSTTSEAALYTGTSVT
jgi:hypothetical protein